MATTRSSRRIRLVEWFNLESIGKSPARFDFAKLENLNGHYIRHMADAELLEHFIDFLPHAEGGKALLAQIDDAMMAKLLRAMPGLKERAKTLVELMKGAQFLFAVAAPGAGRQGQADHRPMAVARSCAA